MKPDFIKVLDLKPRLEKYENSPILDWVIDQVELERALEEKCKVVYGRQSLDHGDWEYIRDSKHTHTAFIFGETPIVKEPCKHEPFFPEASAGKVSVSLGGPRCKHCGEKLKPVAWEIE